MKPHLTFLHSLSTSFIGLRVASFFFLPHCVFISQHGSFLYISALLWFCLSPAKGRRSCESEQMFRETPTFSANSFAASPLIWSLLVLYKTPLTSHLSMPMLSLLLVFLEVSLCVWTIPIIWFQTVESGHSSTTVLWVGRTQMWVNGRGRSVYISRPTDTPAAPQSSLTNGCCPLPTASSSLVQSESVLLHLCMVVSVFVFFFARLFLSFSCRCYQRRKLDIC